MLSIIFQNNIWNFKIMLDLNNKTNPSIMIILKNGLKHGPNFHMIQIWTKEAHTRFPFPQSIVTMWFNTVLILLYWFFSLFFLESVRSLSFSTVIPTRCCITILFSDSLLLFDTSFCSFFSFDLSFFLLLLFFRYVFSLFSYYVF